MYMNAFTSLRSRLCSKTYIIKIVLNSFSAAEVPENKLQEFLDFFFFLFKVNILQRYCNVKLALSLVSKLTFRKINSAVKGCDANFASGKTYKFPKNFYRKN